MTLGQQKSQNPKTENTHTKEIFGPIWPKTQVLGAQGQKKQAKKQEMSHKFRMALLSKCSNRDLPGTAGETAGSVKSHAGGKVLPSSLNQAIRKSLR